MSEGVRTATRAQPSQRGSAVALVAAMVALTATAATGQDTVVLQHRLSAVLDSARAETGIPGLSLGVVLPDGTVLAATSGTEDRAGLRPLVTGARMPAGSVGKTWFAATALQLMEEGRLTLDDRVGSHLARHNWWTSVPNRQGMTVRHLLQHRTGLARYVIDPDFLARVNADPGGSFTLAEQLSYAADDGPLFPPGQGWAYSDTNFLLLAAVIESVTGRTAYDEIRRRFLDPLGLDDTLASDRPDLPGLVQGHAGTSNPFGGFDEALAPDGELVLNPAFEWGGGGFVSSARDLARWTRALQSGAVFSFPETVSRMHQGVPAPLGPAGRYGLGAIGVTLPAVGEAWGHSGFWPGYLTEAYHLPEHDLTLALMSNSSARADVTVPLMQILERLAAATLALMGEGS